MPEPALSIVRVPGWERFPEIVHGFTTRAGGVSPFPADALNFGRRVGDDPANVAENLRRLAAAEGFHAERIAFLAQVHGAEVVVREAADDLARMEADGQVTRVPRLVLAVLVADCVPILLYDPRARAVGVAHAGWRGTVRGVLTRTIERMTMSFGSRPADLRIGMGPCISGAAYAVGEEVAAEFDRAFGPDAGVVIRCPGARPHVDLVAANRRDALRSGVLPEHVVWTGHCTVTENDRFFSHRAEAGQTGRMMGYIGLVER